MDVRTDRQAGWGRLWWRLRRRIAARAVVVGVVAVAAALAGQAPANAASVATVGRTYDDGLDSRYSAQRLAQAARAVGYTGSAYASGRDADDAWLDGLGSAVIGYFGHANAGVFQLDEGPTDSEDEIMLAGTATEPVSVWAHVRYWSEYLPYTDVDDVRLAVLAGCYTANTDPRFGSFPQIGAERGMDSIVSFPGLVYYPAKCTSCNYSGNYFWHRFSYYMQRGSTVATALSRARTDLVAKEGSAGGWNTYRIAGSVASPGRVKLTPAGSGEPLTSRPYGIQPFSLSELTTVSRVDGSSPVSTTVEVATAEGVEYRLDNQGRLLDLSAPTATRGEVRVSKAQALAIAAGFARRHAAGFSEDWLREDADIAAHVDGEQLAAFRWRPGSSDGRPGPSVVEVEVDRRTGAVTGYAAVSVTPAAGGFAVDRDRAVQIASRVADTSGARIDAVADVWDAPRWTVTVDRGLNGGFPDLDRIIIDARTGDVLSRTTA